MFSSYEDAVLAAADEEGRLSRRDATHLLAEHGFEWCDVYHDHHGQSWAELDERRAEALLAWLGY